MKRFIATTLAAVMLSTSLVFADTTANVFVGNNLVQYSTQQPLIINERTYVPIRDVFEKMDFNVDWYEETKMVTLSNDYYFIYLFTKTNKMLLVNVKFDMDYVTLQNPVKLVNGRTMLPLREIVESVGYSVKWDAETKSSILNDNNDYTEFDAYKEKIDNFELEDTYEYDPEKPSKDLTEEEEAFLKNYYEVLDEISELADTMYDMTEDISSADVEKIKKAFNLYAKKFSEVECPESLKGLDTNTVELFNSILDKADILSKMANDNPDLGDDMAGFGFAIMMIIGMQANDAIEPLTNLCKEKNIDMSALAERFGIDTDTDKEPDALNDIDDIVVFDD